MYSNNAFTKENLDNCLKELAKEFRKKNGSNMPAEIILIGGASVLLNYGFRDMTYDIDAIIASSGAMKDAIITVGDRLNLPYGWLNTDFMNTDSYSPKLVSVSKYYKTFSNILQIRTITAEYLVAMKLMSGRQYKSDLSDIVGILVEQINRGAAISFEKIQNAVIELYGDYSILPENSSVFINAIFDKDDLSSFYKQCREMEMENREILIKFVSEYPGKLSEGNLSDVLKRAREKRNKEN